MKCQANVPIDIVCVSDDEMRRCLLGDVVQLESCFVLDDDNTQSCGQHKHTQNNTTYA